MPPLVALAACTLLVIILLRLTTRRGEGKSRALWVPTIWILIVASRPVGRWFTTGSVFEANVSVGAGSLYDQITLVSLIIFSLFIISRRSFPWSRIVRKNPWVFVLLLYMGVSILWSGYPQVSVKRWIKEIGAVLCAMVVMTERNPLEAMEVILRRMAYTLIPFSFVLIKYFPYLGVSYSRWSGARMAIGVCLHKNGLGLLCSISIFFLLWDFLRNLRKKTIREDKKGAFSDVFILTLSVYLLSGADTDSYSATSLGIVALGLAVILGFSRLRNRPQNVPGAVISAALFALLIFFGVSLVAGKPALSVWSGMLGRNDTLTGRVDIWAEVFKIAPRFSFLGTGFGAFWGLPYTFIPIGQMSGHSGYLDAYVELGLIGVVILGVLLLWLLFRLAIFARYAFEWSILGVCLCLVSFAYNYTETDYLDTSSSLWTILIFLSFVIAGIVATQSPSRALPAHLVAEQAPPINNSHTQGGIESWQR